MILKDICKINSGKSIKSCLISNKDIIHNIPCFGGNGLRGFVSSPNQVGGNPIIGRVGAQCGNIHYCGEPFYATEHALVVTIKDDNVNPQWLCRKFESMKLGTYAEGAAQPVIAASKLLQLEIAIPPLSEQQSIVDYLDSAFAKIDAMKANAEKALNEAKALFQASLKEMLEPKEGWEEKTLPDISENLDSKRKPVTKGKREAGIYPYYGASGIVDYVSDYIFDEDILLISEDGANLVARSTPIAFSVSGKVWVNNHAHILKFQNIYTQYFVEYYFASIKIDEYVTGAAQPKFSQKNMNKLPIWIPSLSEQQSIVATLDSLKSKVDRLQANYDKISQECDALKQAILRQVFE